MDVDEFRIGAGSLTVNGSDVGGTTEEGAIVTVEPNVHLHKSGKYGTTPVKASLIGYNVTLQITIAETTKTNMARVIAGAVSEDSRIKIGGLAGRALTGVEIILTPFDGSPMWRIKNAVPTTSIEMAYQVENERVFQVTYTGMVDHDAVEDENIADFS
jgi:hypothetical protein